MKNNVVVFIESNTTGTGIQFIQVAKELGYETCLLTNNSDRYPWAVDITEIFEVNTNCFHSLESKVTEIRKKNIIKGIISSSDYYIPTVARLARRLNLHSASASSITDCRNKFKMRQRLERNGLSTIRYCKVKKGDDLESIFEYVKFPLVVKPAAGSGSENVILCQDTYQANESLKKIFAKTFNSRGQRNIDYALVEQFVEGPEFSVEIFCNPEPRPITVVKKHLGPEPYFVEIGHDVPAPIGQETYNALTAAAQKAVKAMGLDLGCAHVELRLTEAGPVIIEINPRLAGGMIPHLIDLSHGIDLIELQVKALLGYKVQLDSKIPLKRCSSIRFLLPPRSGYLKRIDNLDKIQATEGVLKVELYSRMGSFIDLKGDFTDRIGSIIFSTENYDNCGDLSNVAVSDVEFIFEDDETEPK